MDPTENKSKLSLQCRKKHELHTKMAPPLTKDQQEDLREFYYDEGNLLGRDRLYQKFKTENPKSEVSRRQVWNFLNAQTIHQKHMKPRLPRSTIRPLVAKSLGSCQIDCMNFQSMPFNGYDTIISMIDIMSKKLWTYAAKGQTVENTKRAVASWLDAGAKITYLSSDNGSEFLGDFVQFLKDRDIVHHFNLPHKPWGQGIIERSNSVVKRLLFQNMEVKRNNDWVSILPKVTDTINNSFSFATGKTPNDVEENESLHGAVGTKIENRAKKKYGQKGTAGSDLKVGDHVRKILPYNPSGIRKISKEGYFDVDHEYVITAVMQSKKYVNTTAAYKIKDITKDQPEPGSIARWELQKIPENSYTLPQEERNPEPEESGEYVVESILDRSVYRGKTKYKIKWKGWSHKHNTWEPASNLKNARKLILQYEKTHAD
jgi:transposase InsO family protein